MRPHDIIIRPIVTEKSVRLNSLKVKSSKTKEERVICKLTFEVALNATKPQIKKAVEKLFNVKVEKVNTMIIRGKKRGRLKFMQGRTKTWKKAIVTLKQGYELDIQNLVV
jgi:large subunit ribosomal protein L23